MTNKYKKELIKLQLEFDEKKKELEEKEMSYKLNGISPSEREMAKFLHKQFCKLNHTDECDYDDGSWSAYSRKKYLKKARKFNNYNHNIVRDIITLATDSI